MKVKILLIAFIIMGLSYTLFQILINDNEKVMSQKEAEALATSLYGGKVLKTTAEKGNYQISIENNKGIYDLSIDGETQKVSNVKLVEKKEKKLTVEEAEKYLEKELGGQINEINELNKDGQLLVEATLEKDQKQFRIEYDLKKKEIVSNEEVKVATSPQEVDPVGNHSEKDKSSISEQQAKEIALSEINGQVTNVSKVTTQKGEHYKITVEGLSDGAHVFVQGNTGIISSITWYSKKQNQPNQQDDDDDQDDEHDDSDDNEDD